MTAQAFPPSRILITAALALLPAGACLRAHVDDESAMRMRLEPGRMELRLTFHLLTLGRFVPLDADGDRAVSKSELDSARPELTAFLRQHVPIEINRRPAMLPERPRFDYIWPHAENFPPVPFNELSSRYVDVIFTHDTSPEPLEDVWLGFDFFQQTGSLHTIRGVFEQEGQITEVPFSEQEPEYLYDTGYTAESLAKNATASSTPPASANPPRRNRGGSIVLAVLALAVALLVWSRAKRRGVAS